MHYCVLHPCISNAILNALSLCIPRIIVCFFHATLLHHCVLVPYASPALLGAPSLCIPCIIVYSFLVYPLHYCMLLPCVSPASLRDNCLHIPCSLPCSFQFLCSFSCFFFNPRFILSSIYCSLSPSHCSVIVSMCPCCRQECLPDHPTSFARLQFEFKYF